MTNVTPIKTGTRKRRLLHCADINELADPEYLIDGVIPKDSVIAMYGKPGAKKGFVILDLVMTIGALTLDELRRGVKLDWHGHEVEHGAVLYVWAEGQAGIKKRITAWRQMRQRMNVGHSVTVLPEAVNLLDPAFVTELIEAADDVAEAHGMPVKLIVLDTLSKCSGGANINQPGEMGALADAIERIKTVTGATIVIIHHEGKDETRGMMGASTFKGAIDVELRVSGEDRDVLVEGGKTKDDQPPVFAFKTRVVDVVDPKTRQPMLTRTGKQVTTLTLDMVDPSEASDAVRPKQKPLSNNQANVYQAFLDWLNDNKTDSMPEDQWTPVMKGRGFDRKRAWELRNALDRIGLIRIENETITLGAKLRN
jgi:putative DNA primase/helicase